MLYSGYASGTIRLTSRIAVDLGVRYDVFSPVRTTTANSALLFNPATNTTTAGGTASSGSYDTNNVAPTRGGCDSRNAADCVSYRLRDQLLPSAVPLLRAEHPGDSATLSVPGSFGSTAFTIPFRGWCRRS